MKPFPSNLSPEDRRTYRRWVGGMFLSYLVAVTIVIGITLPRSASDMRASSEIQVARLKGTTGSLVALPANGLTTSRP
jgi:hypothetical protein